MKSGKPILYCAECGEPDCCFIEFGADLLENLEAMVKWSKLVVSTGTYPAPTALARAEAAIAKARGGK